MPDAWYRRISWSTSLRTPSPPSRTSPTKRRLRGRPTEIDRSALPSGDRDRSPTPLLAHNSSSSPTTSTLSGSSLDEPQPPYSHKMPSSVHNPPHTMMTLPLVVVGPSSTGSATATTTTTASAASTSSTAWTKSPPTLAWKAISSCLLYSFCSVSMILTNKSLASSYNHLIDGNLNVLLVVFQAVTAVVLVEGCRQAKVVDYPNLTTSTLQAWAPVNVFFCLMLFTGMASLQTNSVPMVTVFKNVANLCTATGDYLLYGNRPEPLAMAAFGIMLSGAVFAAYHDLSMTVVGLFWMVANCVSTSGYVLYMKYATQTIQMNKFGMVFVNNVLCVLFLLPVATLTGEVSILLRSPSIHTWEYAGKNAFAGCVGFFLNFASLQCVAAAGATTYAIVGSLNKVPVAVLGVLFFATPLTQQTAFFVTVSLCGGFLYSYAKLTTARALASSSGGTDK